jgi:aspartate/tyrosine/aromatic aminotransferase
MLETIPVAPPDPILGLTEAFKTDPNPDKINLGVGVYRDESGFTPIFAAVKEAERRLVESETTKTYLPINGSPEYADAVQRLLLGAGSELVASGRAVTVQTPGGTGALRVAADLLRKFQPGAAVWVSEPTWSNHLGIFGDAGFEVKTYPYYDAEAKAIDGDAMLAALRTVPAGDLVLLHACCHNPTGMDLSADQWAAVAATLADGSALPLLDFAYQGFGEGLDADASAVRTVCAACPEAFVANSFSKNFGLYSERVGALTAVCSEPNTAMATLSQLKIAIRRNYSNPPSHGSAVVTTVLDDAILRQQWEAELDAVRDRIHEMRRLLVEGLKSRGPDFSFLLRQTGMFSYSGLSKDQVAELRDKHSVYLVGSGRINVAGINTGNVDRLCDAITAVVKD